MGVVFGGGMGFSRCVSGIPNPANDHEGGGGGGRDGLNQSGGASSSLGSISKIQTIMNQSLPK